MRSIFSREAQLERLRSDSAAWDIIVIGGGATGAGVAVDAASRGYRVALFEQHDFGKGTSSRSTKLIHGGLRYLKQGRVRLVRDALIERGLLLRNATHLVRSLPTIVPVYSRWESFYYTLGLKVYDRLSGRWSLGRSRRLSREQTVAAIPTIQPNGLFGGVTYLDGAFDDARLLVNLVQTAIEQGAVCVNHAAVRELIKESGRVVGVVAQDGETGSTLRVVARVVVNATGPFTDQVLRLDDAAGPAVIAPSQGIHLVFDRKLLPGSSALLVPRTRDGRVIFAIPWHDHVVVGTTDTRRDDVPVEPRALPGEIEFLLETIAPYVSCKPAQSDIRSIFAGIRPLVRSAGVEQTSQLGRDHLIRVSPSGLISVLGGKWTTYRRMAEDCVDRAAEVGGLKPVQCCTKTLAIHGYQIGMPSERFAEYGADGPALEELIRKVPGSNDRLADGLPYVAGQVIHAARQEMARTVEDVLARRLRALFLDAEAAVAAAPRVAALMAAELGRDAKWQTDQLEQFRLVAEAYRPN
jgi:glycerol-3-phosphate dehydrogenase